jgi:hypothetical protein
LANRTEEGLFVVRAKWTFVLALCAFVLLSFGLSRPSIAQDDSTTLPADLIFTVPESPDLFWAHQPHNRLVRLDAQTLEISPFYTDDVAVEIRALDWSPQGDQLVIYRRYAPLSTSKYASPHELCILDAGGSLLRCIQDRPSMFLDEVKDYHVSWSADGQTIAFVADREIEGDNHELVLVEVDVNTGETLRTLYSTSYIWRKETPKRLAWTPALDVVLVGVKIPSDGRSPLLVDLQTGAETSIDTFVPEHQHLGYVCPQFSPNGTYFSAYLDYDLDEYNPWGLDFGALHHISQLVIMDRGGSIKATLGEPNGTDMLQFVDCPVWPPDEQSFYARGGQLNGEGTFIFQYFLTTQQLVQRQSISSFVVSQPVLSPDNQTLAFDAYLSLNSGAELVVYVLFPDGTTRWFWEHDYSAYPAWVPLN